MKRIGLGARIHLAIASYSTPDSIIVVGSGVSCSSVAQRLLSENTNIALVVCETSLSVPHVFVENDEKRQSSLGEVLQMKIVDFDRLMKDSILVFSELKYEWEKIPSLVFQNKEVSFPKVLPFNKQQYVNSRFRPRSSIHVKKSR